MIFWMEGISSIDFVYVCPSPWQVQVGPLKINIMKRISLFFCIPLPGNRFHGPAKSISSVSGF